MPYWILFAASVIVGATPQLITTFDDWPKAKAIVSAICAISAALLLNKQVKKIKQQRALSKPPTLLSVAFLVIVASSALSTSCATTQPHTWNDYKDTIVECAKINTQNADLTTATVRCIQGLVSQDFIACLDAIPSVGRWSYQELICTLARLNSHPDMLSAPHDNMLIAEKAGEFLKNHRIRTR